VNSDAITGPASVASCREDGNVVLLAVGVSRYQRQILPLEWGLDHLAAEITRNHTMEKMLAARDEEGMTPADVLPDPGELRRRIGILPARYAAR
jgi:hypothetical protein